MDFSSIDKQLAGLGVPVDTQTIGIILISLIVVFITASLLFGKKKVKGDSILLLGDANSGKTLLFLKLVHDLKHETQASMKLGEGVYKFEDNGGKPKSIKVVDLPGHQRLRTQVDALVPTAAGIVFLIDSADFKEVPVTSYLYELLINKTINKRDIPILIVLNKSDLEQAWPLSVIKSALEKELNGLRRTRQAMPKAHGSKDADEAIFLGIENKAFSFDQLPVNVTFTTASVRDGKIDEILDFIVNRA